MPVRALLTLFLFAVSLALLSLPEAEAARLGGGRSFGSRPHMQRPAAPPAQQRPAMPNSAAATAQGQAAKPGMLGGMGGMLGGLLAGTLIGSLLSGGGFQGGGFMDLLLIALLAFLAFKLFARLRGGAGAPAGAMREATVAAGPGGGDAWGAFRDSAPAGESGPATPSVPADFDSEEFLRGAKMAFNRLQKSWDERNLEDIALFATPSVMQEVQAQMRQDPTPGHTEILLVNARLVNVQNAGDTQTASVFFDTLLRENPGGDTTQVREIWHFVRPLRGTDSWKLDGIQQVE